MESKVIEIDGVDYTLYNAKSFYDKLEQDVMSQWRKQLEAEILEFKTNSEKAKGESKYYTPKIEEFYVGFETEYLTIDNEWVDNAFGYIRNMGEEQLDLSPIKRILFDSVHKDDIRVKFLDKLDVESLGFSYEGTNQKSNPVFLMMKELPGVNNLQNIFMTFDKANNTVDIKIVNITDSISYENSTNTMTFKAKNKSELKRILESLNIL